MTQTLTVLELIDVNKIYSISRDDKLIVLKDISFSVQKGEIIVIMGPSGSGKSTLLNLITGLETPTSGQIILMNEDLTILSDDERTLLRGKLIGILFQFFELHKGLTCRETVELGLVVKGNYEESIEEKVEALLKEVGLLDQFDQLVDTCSRGEKQRVAIARALISEPQIIVADEPTGALNPEIAIEVISLLKSIVKSQNRTLVISTHDYNIIEIGDRVISLEKGSILEDKVITNREKYLEEKGVISLY